MLIEHQRFTAMSAMCASVAHDIRSPLTALVWNLRVLEERIQQRGVAVDPEINEVFQDTHLACDLIEGVLEGLRTFASGSGAPRLFDAHHVLVTTMRLFRWHIAQRGVRFQQHMEPDLGAWGTPGEVCQIILNLLANAADASPRGGMVRLDARKTADGVHIRVSDEGPGIALSESEAVFEPFHTTKEGGLGIGLSVSRAMARRHGGDLVVVTSPRQAEGACLELRLRARAATEE
jgi:signal transduction histidine kinase